jgi:hypothetical protein
MLKELLPYSPLAFLIIYNNYSKGKFLRDANKEESILKNINSKSINIKIAFSNIYIVLFILYYHLLNLKILELVDFNYRTILNSTIIVLFIMTSILINRANKDFYIKDNVIHFIFGRTFELNTNYSYEIISKKKFYTLVRLISTYEKSKTKDIKIYVYNNNKEFFEKIK